MVIENNKSGHYGIFNSLGLETALEVYVIWPIY